MLFLKSGFLHNIFVTLFVTFSSMLHYVFFFKFEAVKQCALKCMPSAPIKFIIVFFTLYRNCRTSF